VLVDRNSDGTQEVGPPADPTKDGWWEKVVPFYGAPTQQPFPAGNCRYDPNDDSNNENDISDASPTFVFSSAGSVFGPSSTCFPEFVYGCAGDTQDPPYDPQLGQLEPSVNCFPEVNANGTQIYREGPGPGRWIETKVDLYPYRGRQIWFRFLTSTVQIGASTWTAALAGEFGGVFGGNRDDGWYIDDINITGLNTASFSLKADTDAPPASSCPDPNTCQPITGHVSGSTFPTRTDLVDNDADGTVDESAEGAFTTVPSDAPLRNVLLNAQDSANPTTTAGCLGGVLQYRYSIDADLDGTASPSEVFRDWTEDPHANANPAVTSRVLMEVRCSTLTTCQGRASLMVVINDTPTLFFDKAAAAPFQTEENKNLLEWTPTTGASTYDVSTKQAVPAATVAASGWLGAGGYFDSMACRSNSQACGDTDGDTLCQFGIAADGDPAAGTLDLWLVRKHGGSWEEPGSSALATTTRDSVMVDTTPVCP
jgi:hypothetical protein